MGKSIVSYLFLLTLISCSILERKHTPAPKKQTPRPSLEKKPSVVTSKSKTAPRGEAVWHLVSPLGIELAISHVATGKKELLKIETNLSEIDLLPGQWVVSGFVLDGQTYEALSDRPQFTFELKGRDQVYVGSYVIECPKIGEANLSELRKMKFFSRYSFSNERGPCEMVVGDDLVNVRREWAKLEKSSAKKLRLGF